MGQPCDISSPEKYNVYSFNSLPLGDLNKILDLVFFTLH